LSLFHFSQAIKFLAIFYGALTFWFFWGKPKEHKKIKEKSLIFITIDYQRFKVHVIGSEVEGWPNFLTKWY
jgi:hypothetical protein